MMVAVQHRRYLGGTAIQIIVVIPTVVVTSFKMKNTTTILEHDKMMTTSGIGS